MLRWRHFKVEMAPLHSMEMAFEEWGEGAAFEMAVEEMVFFKMRWAQTNIEGNVHLGGNGH